MSEQPLFDMEALRKIDAKPGDVFVLELPGEYDCPDGAEAERISATIRSVLGDVRVLVVPPGCQLQKHTPAEGDVFALKIADNFAPLSKEEEEQLTASLQENLRRAQVVVLQPGIELRKVEDNTIFGSPSGSSAEPVFRECTLNVNPGGLAVPSLFPPEIAAEVAKVDAAIGQAIDKWSMALFEEACKKMEETAAEKKPEALLEVLQTTHVRANVSQCLKGLPDAVLAQPRPSPGQTWREVIDEANSHDLLTGTVYLWVPSNQNEVHAINPADMVAVDNPPTKYRLVGPDVEILAAQIVTPTCNPTAAPELKQETWRDRPPML